MWYKLLHSTRARFGFVICSWSVYSSPLCAPRAFPSEYGLLFRTPGIANGTLLACLMWAEQRGNKEYGNLQIITELKTSCPLSPTHKVLCSISKHSQTFSLVLMLARQTHAVFSTLGVGGCIAYIFERQHFRSQLYNPPKSMCHCFSRLG